LDSVTLDMSKAYQKWSYVENANRFFSHQATSEQVTMLNLNKVFLK